MSLERVIAVAEGEVGKTEWPPGSNQIEYWGIFGQGWQGQPWCVAYLAWCFRKADEAQAFFGGALTASCRTLRDWYKAMGQTVPVSEAQRGDILIYNFSGAKWLDGLPDTEHCGLVWTRQGNAIYAYEGNTSKGEVGSQDNGGCVASRRRYPSQIISVCRPKYKAEEVKIVDDITGHWSEKDALWCKEHHIMNGYPDGSFRPENPVLRGEEAAIAHRLYDYTFARLMEEITELKKEVARLKELVK